MDSTYSLALEVRGKLADDIIRMVYRRENEGRITKLVPRENTNGNGRVTPMRARYVPPKSIDDDKLRQARDIVYATLKGNGPMPRKTISEALTAKGYAVDSTGPICRLLQKDGVIKSPKRGFWQVTR